MCQLWRMAAVRASSRRLMRLTRPVRVRPPWRSSESWSLRVPKVRLDPLADAAEGAEAWLLVFAVGAEQTTAEGGDVRFEVGAGEAFVADHDLAVFEDALE